MTGTWSVRRWCDPWNGCAILVHDGCNEITKHNYQPIPHNTRIKRHTYVERDRRRDRDRDFELDDCERPRPRPDLGRSSISLMRRPFRSVPSSLSMALRISADETNSTTLNDKMVTIKNMWLKDNWNLLHMHFNSYPSWRRCLCASAYVTSPAWRM